MEAVKLLLKYGADANMFNEEGKTPLHLGGPTIFRKCIVKLLLDAGAEPNQADNDGRTPLHSEAKDGTIEAIKLLLDAVDVWLGLAPCALPASRAALHPRGRGSPSMETGRAAPPSLPHNDIQLGPPARRDCNNFVMQRKRCV